MTKTRRGSATAADASAPRKPEELRLRAAKVESQSSEWTQLRAEVHARAIEGQLYAALTMADQAGWVEATDVLGRLHLDAARRRRELEPST